MGDWLTGLRRYGIEGEISEEGVLSLSGPGIITGELGSFLGIGMTVVGSEISGTKQESEVLSGKETIVANETSTLGSLGLTGGELEITTTSSTKITKNYSTNTTLGTILEDIRNAGGEAELRNGKIEITGVEKLEGSIVQALGLSSNEVNGTTVYSNNVQYTSGSIATENSKFIEYGISTTDKKFNVYSSNGELQASNLTIGSDATIKDLFNVLQGFGLSGTVDSTGAINISGGYISGDLASALGMSTTAYSTIIEDKTFVSNKVTANLSTTASLNTTLSQLGISGTQYLTVNCNGTFSGYNFSGNSTIGDIRNAVTSAGGEFELRDGAITISGVEISGTLATNLGISHKNGAVINGQTVEVSYTVQTMFITSTIVTTQITANSQVEVITNVITQTLVSTIASTTIPPQIVTITMVQSQTSMQEDTYAVIANNSVVGKGKNVDIDTPFGALVYSASGRYVITINIDLTNLGYVNGPTLWNSSTYKDIVVEFNADDTYNTAAKKIEQALKDNGFEASVLYNGDNIDIDLGLDEWVRDNTPSTCIMPDNRIYYYQTLKVSFSIADTSNILGAAADKHIIQSNSNSIIKNGSYNYSNRSEEFSYAYDYGDTITVADFSDIVDFSMRIDVDSSVTTKYDYTVDSEETAAIPDNIVSTFKMYKTEVTYQTILAEYYVTAPTLVTMSEPGTVEYIANSVTLTTYNGKVPVETLVTVRTNLYTQLEDLGFSSYKYSFRCNGTYQTITFDGTDSAMSIATKLKSYLEGIGGTDINLSVTDNKIQISSTDIFTNNLIYKGSWRDDFGRLTISYSQTANYLNNGGTPTRQYAINIEISPRNITKTQTVLVTSTDILTTTGEVPDGANILFRETIRWSDTIQTYNTVIKTINNTNIEAAINRYVINS